MERELFLYGQGAPELDCVVVVVFGMMILFTGWWWGNGRNCVVEGSRDAHTSTFSLTATHNRSQNTEKKNCGAPENCIPNRVVCRGRCVCTLLFRNCKSLGIASCHGTERLVRMYVWLAQWTLAVSLGELCHDRDSSRAIVGVRLRSPFCRCNSRCP